MTYISWSIDFALYHCHRQITVKWDIFASPNFRGFVSKTWVLFFAEFNFRGRQRPQKIISILFHENRRVGCTARLSLDRSTVRKEKYLKPNGIEDTCSLTNKQTKRTYLHSDGCIKQNKTMECMSCLLVTLCQTTLFAIKQLMVYSECNINANILFNKETKTIICMSNTTTKENWSAWHWVNRISHASINRLSNGL